MTKENQASRILRLLRSERTVTNKQLNRICFRYGARIFELRREGWNIQKESLGRGLFQYWLVPEPEEGDSY